MSKITLVSPASGTAEFSITTPSGTSTDRTLTLPDAGGTVVSDTATQTLTNKTLTSPTLTTPNINSAQVATVSGTAPIYMCRAWVNFNGAPSQPGSIRASGNVSSVTHNDAGTYAVNFTTAMQDADYAFTATAGLGTGIGARIATQESAVSASSITFRIRTVGDVNVNVSTFCAAIFR
jgi:hypothetical protein